jgi:hypothetical protein
MRLALGRRVERIAPTLVFGIAVAACSSGNRGSTGALPTSPVSTDALLPTQPSIPMRQELLHPARRLDADVPGKLLSMPWELVDIRQGGKVLIVYYVSGDGIHPHGVNNIGFRVIEAADSVELIAVSRNDNPGPDEAGSLALGYARGPSVRTARNSAAVACAHRLVSRPTNRLVPSEEPHDYADASCTD